jgi:aspartyl-tRNA(Asn)/glutamyl-tRNA(Gln) amidotransferase subunit B
LNSLKQIIQSAEFEALRQTSQILDGSPTGRETRTFDPKTGNTTKIRDKGGAVDYRFMPEPDLPPVKLNRNILGKDSLQEFLEDNLPELPEEATNRLTNEYGIPEASALIITSDRPAILFFEDAIARCITELKEGNQISTDKVSISIANWLCNDVFALIKESAMKKEGEDTETEGFLNHPISVEHSNVDSTRLGSLVALILNKTVSTTQGKKLLGVMYNEDMNSLPLEIAEQNNWKLISDLNQLKTLCRDVIMDGKNAKQFEQYKQGGKNVRKMTKFFTGKIMAESRGNAQPEILGTALQIMLEELAPGVEE